MANSRVVLTFFEHVPGGNQSDTTQAYFHEFVVHSIDVGLIGDAEALAVVLRIGR